MKITLTLLIVLGILGQKIVHAEETYVEPGRFGAEWAVTEDTVFIGPTYKSDTLDAALFVSGHSFTDGAAVKSWVINTPQCQDRCRNLIVKNQGRKDINKCNEFNTQKSLNDQQYRKSS